jgi:IclR family acetate operon transcriptional repressor
MPSASNGQQTPLIQSLDRGLVILEAVGRSGDPVSLGELTNLLGIDRSSVFRLANTLRRRGFLAYPAGRKDYILGPSIWRLSHEYDWGNMLIAVSHERLKSLAAQTNETAHLAVRDGRQALFIDHAMASHVLSVSGQTGELVPLYCTAHGKALLADHDKRALKDVLGAGPYRQLTKATPATLDQVARICSHCREQGFATDDEEFMEGVRCVAAPIRAEGCLIIGSIGISAPRMRFPKERFASCGEQVREVARQISTKLTIQAQEV